MEGPEKPIWKVWPVSVDDSSSTEAAGLSRRGFLGATSAVAAATTILGAGPAEAAPRVSLDQERTVILRIAEAGVTFPFRLPRYDEPGPPKARRSIAELRKAQRRFPGRGVALGEGRPATMSRLLAAERRLPADHVARARAGADALVTRGVLNTGQAALIESVGDIWATGAQPARDDLLAAVTLAVATVFPGSAAQFETSARQWVSLVGLMHQRGTLADALAHSGIA